MTKPGMQFPSDLFVTRSTYLVAVLLLNISIINADQRIPGRSLITELTAVQESVATVAPGKSKETGLGGGQRHVYLIAVPPGSYLNLVVNQLGIDVVLTIYRNSDEELIEVDKANGTRGSETLSLLFDATSSYRLQIRAREEKAVAGRYAVEITDVHPATPQDETRWKAEQSFVLGKQFLKQAELSQAIEKYLESLKLWRFAKDAEGEALTLLNLGNAYFTAGKTRQAWDHYKAAEAIFQSLDDPFNTALTVLYIGMCTLALGDTAGALTQYNQALELFTQLDDQKYLAFALNEIGRVHYSQGQGVQARDYFLQAIEIRKSVDDRKGLAFSLNVVGRVLFYYFGEDEQAITYYKQALDLQQEIRDERRMAQTLDDIGRIYFSSGRHQEALDHYNTALTLQRKQGDEIGEAETLSYIGMVYTASGRYEEALRDYYQKALKIQQDSEDRVGEGRTLHNMGIAYFSSGAYEKANNSLNAALKIWKDVLFRTAEAETRYGLARVEMARGNLKEARGQIEEALPIVESLRTKIANQHLRISYFASVQNYYELYLDVLMQMHKKFPADGLDKVALSVNERARGRALVDTLIQAQTDISQGVDPSLLKQQKDLERQLTSLSQQRMLRDRQNPEEAAAIKNQLAALLVEYHKVGEQMLQKSPAYAALTQPRVLNSDDIQTKIDQGTVLLEFALGDKRSYLWVVTVSSVNSYELPSGAVIENAVKQLREALTARTKTVVGEGIAATMTRVERADAEAWETAARLSEMLALEKAVAQPPVKRLVIVSDGELQNVPFSMLPIPETPEVKAEVSGQKFGSLIGLAPLIADYEVVMLPSVSVLAEIRRKEGSWSMSGSAKTVIVMADPVFDEIDERVKRTPVRGAAEKSKIKGTRASKAPSQPRVNAPLAEGASNARSFSETFARLPFTRREANEIISLVPSTSGTKVLDFNASRETVNSGLLAQYRIVHFATHARANDEYPELSGLVLSLVNEKGQVQDGLLQLHEIYNLNLPVDLVVLSACETGLGRKVRGEGLIGLTRGFFYAGAKRVVASAWQVNDASTSNLMKYFYQAMLTDRMSAAAALRVAQLKMLKQPQRQAPYYWAAFMLHGEWLASPE
jgi:CHAT domain-containing protein/Flp pilus assembly protein TadD